MQQKRKKKRREPGAFQRWIEHRCLLIAIATLGRLPTSTRFRVARFLGALAARFVPFRRPLLMDNLRRAFPEWTEADRRKLLPAIYTNLFALGFEILGMEHLTREEIEIGVEIDPGSKGRIDMLRDTGKGFVVMTAHFGNWEWVGAYMLALGFDVGIWAKPMHNETTEALIRNQRERMGYSIFYTHQSPLRLFRHVKKGGIIAMLADQDARGEGIFLPFFNYPASTPTGPAWVGVKLGVPILPGFGFRTKDGRVRAWTGEPFYPDKEADEDAEIERALRHYNQQLELAIREEPSQFMWFHRRWKTRPKGETLPDPARMYEDRSP